MAPETLANIAADIMVSCQETTAMLGQQCLSVSQSAEQLAADPMQRNIAGMAMMQGGAAAEVGQMAEGARGAVARTSVTSIGAAREALRSAGLAEARPKAVVRQ